MPDPGDRFADGVSEACRMVLRVIERANFEAQPVTTEALVFRLMLEMQNSGFPDAARELRRGNLP